YCGSPDQTRSQARPVVFHPAHPWTARTGRKRSAEQQSNGCAHLQKFANPSGRRQSGESNGWASPAREKWGHTAERDRNGQEALEKIVVNAAAPFSALEAEVFAESPSFAGHAR